jgi:hypothetical protein
VIDSLVVDADDVDISASVVTDESITIGSDVVCSFSRILFIATFGIIIFSFFPSIYSICF